MIQAHKHNMQKHDHSSEVSYGVPGTLCSDNRPQFASAEMEKSFQSYISLITLPAAPITHKVMGWWNEHLKL